MFSDIGLDDLTGADIIRAIAAHRVRRILDRHAIHYSRIPVEPIGPKVSIGSPTTEDRWSYVRPAPTLDQKSLLLYGV
jgi:hypothetical protein